MTAISITPGYPTFADTDGSPLNDGYVYIGLENQDPITAPTGAFWDKEFQVPADQPLRTSGGYIVRNGTPAAVYTGASYSILVQNKNLVTVYNAPSAVITNVTNDVEIITQYQGAHATDPIARNDGTPLEVGDLYFNTVSNELKVWTGSAWVPASPGAITVQNFTGTGAQTAFNLASAPVAENNTQIYIDGVYQQKDTYTVAGATINFSTAPPNLSGIEVVTFSIAALGTVDASNVSYNEGSAGAVNTSVQSKLQESVSVQDFGADPTGVDDSYPAFVAALAAAQHILIPAGTYKVSQQIDITGDKTITGEVDETGYHPLASVINFTGVSGNCFSAISAEFGGITISNLRISGGWGGGYAVRSSRPQSFFTNIHMEVYNGGGFELFEVYPSGSQASWSTCLENCRWVGPAIQTDFRGFQIRTNGGHVRVHGCVAIRGAIGLNVDQSEALDISNCSFNQQNSTTSSSPATDTCGIRLSGAGYKKAFTIRSCYIEACTYGIIVEKVESLTINDNYIADVGFGSGASSIYLVNGLGSGSDVNNVTIRNNEIYDQGNTKASIDIGDGANNVVVENNRISSVGLYSIGIRKGTTTYSWIRNNTISVSLATGTQISDPNSLIANTDFQNNGFFNYRKRSFIAAHTTWYDVGAVGNDQIWQVVIMDGINAGTWHREDMLFISTTGVATFKNIFDVNPGYATRELQVSGGILQFRVTATATNTNNTISAIRLA
jgi:hypothetical protein